MLSIFSMHSTSVSCGLEESLLLPYGLKMFISLLKNIYDSNCLISFNFGQTSMCCSIRNLGIVFFGSYGHAAYSKSGESLYACTIQYFDFVPSGRVNALFLHALAFYGNMNGQHPSGIA